MKAPPKKNAHRGGEWTGEELAYANAIVQAYNDGLLDIPVGMGLADCLCEKLGCTFDRLRKMFKCGKRTFKPADRIAANKAKLRKVKVTRPCWILEPIEEPLVSVLTVNFFSRLIKISLCQENLDELERRWKEVLQRQQQEDSEVRMMFGLQ
jgi:hypothetical protein